MRLGEAQSTVGGVGGIEAAPTEELGEAIHDRMVNTIYDHKCRLGEGCYDGNDVAVATELPIEQREYLEMDHS